MSQLPLPPLKNAERTAVRKREPGAKDARFQDQDFEISRWGKAGLVQGGTRLVQD